MLRYTLLAAASASTAFAQVASSVSSAVPAAPTGAGAPGLLPSGGLGLDNVTQALASLSPTCQSAVFSLATSNITQCTHVQTLLPLLSNFNSSIIPFLDDYMTDVCGMPPCSNEVLRNSSATLVAGCSTELENYGIANATIEDVFDLYPLARELVCLKTTAPYEPMNITTNATEYYSALNSTNGTFCVSSLLTELSDYLDANITIDYVISAVTSGNTTILSQLESIPLTALCNDCIFAAADLLGQYYPQLWNISVGNTTVSGFLNATCPAASTNLTLSLNGTLPASIYPSAINSTYPFNLTAGTNFTYTAGSDVIPPPQIFPNATMNMTLPMPPMGGSNVTGSVTILPISATGASAPGVPSSAAAPAQPTRRDVTDIKRRWVGEQ